MRETALSKATSTSLVLCESMLGCSAIFQAFAQVGCGAWDARENVLSEGLRL